MRFTEYCKCLVVNSEGLVVNLIVCDENTPDDFSPGSGLTLVKNTVDGAIGGSYIDGVYTPPSEPEEEEDDNNDS